jgi:hypothetical protein
LSVRLTITIPLGLNCFASTRSYHPQLLHNSFTFAWQHIDKFRITAAR